MLEKIKNFGVTVTEEDELLVVTGEKKSLKEVVSFLKNEDYIYDGNLNLGREEQILVTGGTEPGFMTSFNDEASCGMVSLFAAM